MAPFRVPSARRDSDWGERVEQQGTESGRGDGASEGGQLTAARSRGVAGAELSASQADLGAVPHGRKLCSMATAAGTRTVLTGKGFAGRCWNRCGAAMKISDRPWRLSTWPARRGSRCTPRRCGAGCGRRDCGGERGGASPIGAGVRLGGT